MCRVNYGAIILADVPFHSDNPHAHTGTHLYAVVSNEASCKFSPVVNVVPLTSRCAKRRLPTQLEINSNFLPKKSFCLAEQLTLMSKELLEHGKYYGTLETSSMEKLKNAIKVQLALV